MLKKSMENYVFMHVFAQKQQYNENDYKIYLDFTIIGWALSQQ